jgi:hypothetical protein
MARAGNKKPKVGAGAATVDLNTEQQGVLVMARRERVARHYLTGKSLRSIGEIEQVSHETIRLDLEALQAEWLKTALFDFDAARAQELAKIDNLEREYWSEYECSKHDKSRATKKARLDNDRKALPVEVSETKEGRLGDTRYLDGVQWCIDRRCKLLGLDAKSDSLLKLIDLSKLNEHQLQRLAGGEDILTILLDGAATPDAGGGGVGAEEEAED